MGDVKQGRWLDNLVLEVRPLFVAAGYTVPSKLLVSRGWPSSGGTARVNRVIGQCWPQRLSGDGIYEIFVSPAIEDPIEVAGVVIHELVHAILDCKFGHGALFRRIAVALGLEGPMRATTVGLRLRERLNGVIERIGPYPHAQLTVTSAAVVQIPTIPGEGMRTQATRLVLLQCPSCGYRIRTTRLWIERYQPKLPVCPCPAASEFLAQGTNI